MASYPVHRLAPVRAHRRRSQSGSAMIEFVLAVGLLIVPAFFGMITIGLSLVIANQVTEVCRDTGHMYAYGVDFSQTASQTLVTGQLAAGLGMANSGGRGVIYLSTITYVDASICTAAGLQANSSSCPNINNYVVSKRITIGNSGVHAGSYAPSINSAIIQSSGSISLANYVSDTSVRANNFANLITLTSSQYAYVSEMFLNPPANSLWTLFDTNVVAAYSVF